MIPLAVAATEYGAVASRGTFARLGDVLSSPDADTLAWGAALAVAVLLVGWRSWRLALLLLVVAGAVGAKLLDLW